MGGSGSLGRGAAPLRLLRHGCEPATHARQEISEFLSESSGQWLYSLSRRETHVSGLLRSLYAQAPLVQHGRVRLMATLQEKPAARSAPSHLPVDRQQLIDEVFAEF